VSGRKKVAERATAAETRRKTRDNKKKKTTIHQVRQGNTKLKEVPPKEHVAALVWGHW